MGQIFKFIAIIILVVLPGAILLGGQMGLLSGTRPADLGIKDGMLKPPNMNAWNVVSSYAVKQHHTDYHVIEPMKFEGSGKDAFAKLEAIISNMPGATIITRQDHYLYAEFQTKVLKFTDDVEFVLDEPASVIQMRSASRLGRKDFNVNRERLEAIRAKLKS